MKHHLKPWLLFTVALLSIKSPFGATPSIEFLRVPDHGIQPQAATDSKGVVHLIYLNGDPKSANVFYARRLPGAKDFSKPIQVNHQSGCAIGVGTIRGAQFAIGKNGRIHVAWNGNGRTPNASGHEGAPMLYARLNDAGTAFESERDVMSETWGLDGGGSVAADNEGNVYVVWHARTSASEEGEAGRAVYLARSKDEGKTFERERKVNPKPTGTCGCCGLRAFADVKGTLYVLYRAATEKVNRDETLLVSRNKGDTFEITKAHKWNIATCPMSSAWLTESSGNLLAAWETESQVYFALPKSGRLDFSKVFSPAGSGKRKHPVAVSNANGETLLAWTDGTGWQKGGALEWQIFDKRGMPMSAQGKKDNGIPVWSLVAAIPKADGSFAIIY